MKLMLSSVILYLLASALSSCTAQSWVSIKHTKGAPALSLSAVVLSQAVSASRVLTDIDGHGQVVDVEDENSGTGEERPVGNAELEEMFIHSLSSRYVGDNDAAQRNFRRRLRRKFPRLKLGQVLSFTSKRLQKVLTSPSVDLMLVDVPKSVRVQSMLMQAERKNVNINGLDQWCNACEVLSRELDIAASRSPGALVTRIKPISPKMKVYYTDPEKYDSVREASTPLGLLRDALVGSYEDGITPFSVDSCNHTYCELAMLYRGGWYVLPFHSKETTATEITADLTQLLLTVVHTLYSSKDIKTFVMHQSTTVLIIQHDTSMDAMTEMLHESSIKKLSDRLGGHIPVGWCRDIHLPPLLSVYRRMQRTAEQRERKLPTIVVFRNYLDHSVEETVYDFPLSGSELSTTLSTTKQPGEGTSNSFDQANNNDNVKIWSLDHLVSFIFRARLGLLEKWTEETDVWYQEANRPSVFLLLSGDSHDSGNQQRRRTTGHHHVGHGGHGGRTFSSPEDTNGRKAMLLLASANTYTCATVAREQRYHRLLMQELQLNDDDLPAAVLRVASEYKDLQSGFNVVSPPLNAPADSVHWVHYVFGKNVDRDIDMLHRRDFLKQSKRENGIVIKVPETQENVDAEGEEDDHVSNGNNDGVQRITAVDSAEDQDTESVLSSLFSWMNEPNDNSEMGAMDLIASKKKTTRDNGELGKSQRGSKKRKKKRARKESLPTQEAFLKDFDYHTETNQHLSPIADVNSRGLLNPALYTPTKYDPWVDGRNGKDGWIRVRNPALTRKERTRSQKQNELLKRESREDDGTIIINNAINVLEVMHSQGLLSFVYSHVGRHFRHPPLTKSLSAADSFRQAAELASDYLLMHEARKALNALQPKKGEIITTQLTSTASMLLLSSKGMTSFPMPPTIASMYTNSEDEGSDEYAAARGRLNAYLLTTTASLDALEKCRNFMRDDPVGAAMLIRDHSGQLARDLIGSGTASNDWVHLNKTLWRDVKDTIDVALSNGISFGAKASTAMSNAHSRASMVRHWVRVKGRHGSKKARGRLTKGHVKATSVTVDRILDGMREYWAKNEELQSLNEVEKGYASIFDYPGSLPTQLVGDVCDCNSASSLVDATSAAGTINKHHNRKFKRHDEEFLFWLERYKAREELILWNEGISITIDESIKYDPPSRGALIEAMYEQQLKMSMVEADEQNSKDKNEKSDKKGKKNKKRKKKKKKKKDKMKTKTMFSHEEEMGNYYEKHQGDTSWNNDMKSTMALGSLRKPASSHRTEYREIRAAWYNEKSEFVGALHSDSIRSNSTISDLIDSIRTSDALVKMDKRYAVWSDPNIYVPAGDVAQLYVRVMEVRDHSIARVFDPSEPLSHISRIYDTHSYVHKMAMLRIEPMWKIEEHDKDRVCFHGSRIFGELTRFASYGSGQIGVWSGPSSYEFHGSFDPENTTGTYLLTNDPSLVEIEKKIQKKLPISYKKKAIVLSKFMDDSNKNWRYAKKMSFVFNMVHYSVVDRRAHSDPFLLRIDSMDTTRDVMLRVARRLAAKHEEKWSMRRWSYNRIYNDTSMPPLKQWRLVVLKCRQGAPGEKLKGATSQKNRRWWVHQLLHENEFVLEAVLKFIDDKKEMGKETEKESNHNYNRPRGLPADLPSDMQDWLWVRDGMHHQFTLGLVHDRTIDAEFVFQELTTEKKFVNEVATLNMNNFVGMKKNKKEQGIPMASRILRGDYSIYEAIHQVQKMHDHLRNSGPQRKNSGGQNGGRSFFDNGSDRYRYYNQYSQYYGARTLLSILDTLFVIVVILVLAGIVSCLIRGTELLWGRSTHSRSNRNRLRSYRMSMNASARNKPSQQHHNTWKDFAYELLTSMGDPTVFVVDRGLKPFLHGLVAVLINTMRWVWIQVISPGLIAGRERCRRHQNQNHDGFDISIGSADSAGLTNRSKKLSTKKTRHNKKDDGHNKTRKNKSGSKKKLGNNEKGPHRRFDIGKQEKKGCEISRNTVPLTNTASFSLERKDTKTDSLNMLEKEKDKQQVENASSRLVLVQGRVKALPQKKETVTKRREETHKNRIQEETNKINVKAFEAERVAAAEETLVVLEQKTEKALQEEKMMQEIKLMATQREEREAADKTKAARKEADAKKKANIAKQEAAKQEAAKQEAAKQEAAKQAAAKQEAAKREAAKREAAKQAEMKKVKEKEQLDAQKKELQRVADIERQKLLELQRHRHEQEAMEREHEQKTTLKRLAEKQKQKNKDFDMQRAKAQALANQQKIAQERKEKEILEMQEKIRLLQEKLASSEDAQRRLSQQQQLPQLQPPHPQQPQQLQQPQQSQQQYLHHKQHPLQQQQQQHLQHSLDSQYLQSQHSAMQHHHQQHQQQQQQQHQPSQMIHQVSVGINNNGFSSPIGREGVNPAAATWKLPVGPFSHQPQIQPNSSWSNSTGINSPNNEAAFSQFGGFGNGGFGGLSVPPFASQPTPEQKTMDDLTWTALSSLDSLIGAASEDGPRTSGSSWD